MLVFLFLICFNNYSWSQSEPPQIEAVGDSFFCPTTEQPIVTSFSIANPNNIEIVTIFIQISEGYDSSQDRLKLSGANTTVTSFYSISEGKLTLTSSKTGSEALNEDGYAYLEIDSDCSIFDKAMKFYKKEYSLDLDTLTEAYCEEYEDYRDWLDQLDSYDVELIDEKGYTVDNVPEDLSAVLMADDKEDEEDKD